jgi:hypothetical protein
MRITPEHRSLGLGLPSILTAQYGNKETRQ